MDSQLNYQHCLLTVDCNTVAIFKGTLKFFTLIQEIHMAYHTHLENVYKIVPFRQHFLIAFDEGERILICRFSKSVPWVLRGGPACIDVMPFDFRVWTPSWVDGWTDYVAQIASIACGYKISPVGFTRSSRENLIFQNDAFGKNVSCFVSF